MVKADDILLFAQVVENGSFSKVADALHLTNSVVSKRIGRLEDELDIQLLYRTTRKLSLTDAGRLLYSKARIAQTAMKDATDVINGYSQNIRGTIRITLPAVSANLVLNKAIAEFCHKYPDVKVEMNVNNRIIDIIDEGYDLAIRTAYLEDSGLVARRLVDSKWVVCATPEYLQQQGTPEHPCDLHEHKCLIYNYESKGSDSWLFSVNGIEQQIKVKGGFTTNNLNAIREATIADLGIAFLPKALVHHQLQAGKLKEVLTKHASKMMGIYAVYPRSRQPDQKRTLLIEHFRNAFQQQQERFNNSERTTKHSVN